MLSHNVRHFNQSKTESFQYDWLRALAMFDIACLPAILSGIIRDVISSSVDTLIHRRRLLFQAVCLLGRLCAATTRTEQHHRNQYAFLLSLHKSLFLNVIFGIIYFYSLVMKLFFWLIFIESIKASFSRKCCFYLSFYFLYIFLFI